MQKEQWFDNTMTCEKLIAGNVDAELAASMSFDKTTGRLENIRAAGRGELKIGTHLS